MLQVFNPNLSSTIGLGTWRERFRFLCLSPGCCPTPAESCRGRQWRSTKLCPQNLSS